MRVSLFSKARYNRARQHSLKLHKGSLRLDIRKKFFTFCGLSNYWNVLLGKVVESISLEAFKK